jgi:recombination protein RecT
MPKSTEKFQQVADAFKRDNAAEAKAIRMMFPTKTEQDRFLAVVFGLLAAESDILERCTAISIIDSIKSAATMGLIPGTSDGSLIRRGDKCTFLPEYGGYLKRIRNSGKVQDVDTQLVFENDSFTYELGTRPKILHVPVLGERGNLTHAYAWALMMSGTYLIDVMDVDELNYIRDRYGAKDSMGNVVGPWTTNYGEMCRKTTIRRLAKRLPQEAVEAILQADAVADEAVQNLGAIKDGMADLRALALQAVQPTSETLSGPAAQPTEPTEAPADRAPQSVPSA